MNRSEWMANKFKNQNLGSYDWVPEIMTSIDPTPRYHERADPKKAGPRHYKRVRASEGIEGVKTALIKQNQMEERSRTGRLLAHIKQVEMKNLITDVKSNEGTLKQDANFTQEDQVNEILNNSKTSNDLKVKVDDEFNLPYGFGFDDVIKEKADMINNKKFKNNQIMDDLVEKLGYMDYRDALAMNKYILEAKRHGDYHQ
jgi:hypothetical protein